MPRLTVDALVVDFTARGKYAGPGVDFDLVIATVGAVVGLLVVVVTSFVVAFGV